MDTRMLTHRVRSDYPSANSRFRATIIAQGPETRYIREVRLTDRARKLEGERVELRRHTRENYRLYGDWYGDPEVWHLTSWAATPLGHSAVERLFEDRELSNTEDSFAIHLKGEDTPIGVISLMNISEANESADLSVIVGHPEDRHHGYGAEAIGRILRYAFEALRLNRVGLSVFEFNEEAFSTYEKLGFRTEGRLRRAIRRADTFHDAILMSVLKDEWEEDGSSP
ncbi:MAG: GNAT family N-acetyltransferase [Actinomycetota bacterium]|nr:GNAT family N-acetyltransferase [Actinomycetota bacterium]